MATLSPEHAGALNALLADERASVECEIAFASGATEYLEREAFSTMGREDVEICDALHERLASVDASVTSQIGPAGQEILTLERYDDRLRAFGEHQRAVSAHAGELLSDVADHDAQQILRRLSELHVWHALWATRRAEEFAATRLWEDGRRPRVAREGGATPTADAAPESARGGALGATRLSIASAQPQTSEERSGPDGADATAQRRMWELGDAKDGAKDGA